MSGFVDSCQGDSGSGLFVKDEINEKSKYFLAGIVSYGLGWYLKILFNFFILYTILS